MSEPRKILGDNAILKIDRETEEPRWLDCTEEQWEKKAELASRNGDMGEALKYADYANCKALYEAGLTVKQIQDRFNHD